MSNKKRFNIAFVDGQNLNLGTATENWSVDFRRFRLYLKHKYGVEEAYMFL
jgi:prepilin-type processing-associated H-X9-DG protein